jgi:hypothetical protein
MSTTPPDDRVIAPYGAHDGVSAYHYGGSIEFRFWWSHGGTYRAACRAQDFARVFDGQIGQEIGQGGRSPRGVPGAGESDTVEWPPTRVYIPIRHGGPQ